MSKRNGYHLDNGRAAPHGFVTRRSHLVRTRIPGVRPLPLDLQVLPQRLKRMPRHEGCLPCAPGIVTAVHELITTQPAPYFRRMEGLDTEPKAWRIISEGRIAYSDSFAWAMAWANAASYRGIYTHVEKNLDGEAKAGT